MNRQQIELVIAIIFCFVIPIAVIFYDRIRHRKRYKNEEVFIFLHINNPSVRKQIREAGIKLCSCSREFRNNYLYTVDGSLVCGFNENHRHLIADANRFKMNIIDCGTDVEKFIQEIKERLCLELSENQEKQS